MAVHAPHTVHPPNAQRVRHTADSEVVPPDPVAVGERVQHLLERLQASPDPAAAAAAEEMIRSVLGLYGAGLARVADLVGSGGLAALAADPLVEALLLVHDLHPDDPGTRIQRALDRVRPHLGSHSGGVDFLGVDDAGVVRLRLAGSCHGCAASSATARGLLEAAVRDAAPDTAGVHIEGVAPEPVPGLLQIGRRPEHLVCPPVPEVVR